MVGFMIKIKKATQIYDKEESVKILEDKFYLTDDNLNQTKLDQWVSEIEKSEIGEWTDQDVEKWERFRDRYRDKFEDKLNILDKIIAERKGKVKVTWISVFKKKI
jgi:uncharacterized protein YeaO (DUF488 family)